MRRRTFLTGVGGSAIGASALLGSGAFTRIESQRRVKIQVAEDPHAYLGLDGCNGSPNSSYTEIDGSGHLAVEMSPENPTDAGGQGINSDSRSYFDDVFGICNQGKQPVCVWIGDTDWPTYDGTGEKRVEFYTDSSAGASDLTDLTEQSIVGEENAILLPVGECLCVGIAVVSKGLSEGDQVLEDLDDEIVIHADADAECAVGEIPELIPETISLAYEDLPIGAGNDYDYNDFVVDVTTDFQPEINSPVQLNDLMMTFTPQARGGTYTHEFSVRIPDGVLPNGSYELTIFDSDGNEDDTVTGSFTDGTLIEIFVDEYDTGEIFPANITNSEADDDDGTCVEPEYTAQLHVDFDTPWEFDPDEFDFSAPQGTGLYFEPELVVLDEDETIEVGDVRLLSVPTDWKWPLETEAIWNVYDEVSDDDGTPAFDTDDWFDGGFDSELVFESCRL